MKTFESYQDWVETKFGGREHLNHFAPGLAGEASEVQALTLAAVEQALDAIRLGVGAGAVADRLKKHFGHGLPLDRDKLTKELGDVLWYVAAIARQYQIPLTRVVAENVAKLEARYPGGFSTEKAAARADECPPTWRDGEAS